MGNLHIRRSKHENNFTQISNEILKATVIHANSNKITWVPPAVDGIYHRLLACKPGYNLTVKDLATGYGMSMDTIRSYLNVLEKLGYLKTEMIQPSGGGYYTKHYYLQECVNQNILKDYFEPEDEQLYEEESQFIVPTFTKEGSIRKSITNLKKTNQEILQENSHHEFSVVHENRHTESEHENRHTESEHENPQPCITCNNNINNNIIKNNIKKINALSPKEESALRNSERQSILTNSSLALENNRHNNMINVDADQMGSKSKKIKNKAQLHEIEKEKNGGDVSVSEMIISKVSDLSYTDNQLANMQRQMNVISAEQKDAKTKQSKRERQFTLVKDYIDKNVTDPELNEKWKQYALTLKEKGSLASKTQFIEIYNNAQIITNKDKMLECLSNSISHGWVGVYPTDKKDNKKKETEVVQQYTVPTPMKDRKIARDENGNPLLF